jgi:hypothetical protein
MNTNNQEKSPRFAKLMARAAKALAQRHLVASQRLYEQAVEFGSSAFGASHEEILDAQFNLVNVMCKRATGTSSLRKDRPRLLSQAIDLLDSYCATRAKLLTQQLEIAAAASRRARR